MQNMANLLEMQKCKRSKKEKKILLKKWIIHNNYRVQAMIFFIDTKARKRDMTDEQTDGMMDRSGSKIQLRFFY